MIAIMAVSNGPGRGSELSFVELPHLGFWGIFLCSKCSSPKWSPQNTTIQFLFLFLEGEKTSLLVSLQWTVFHKQRINKGIIKQPYGVKPQRPFICLWLCSIKCKSPAITFGPAVERSGKKATVILTLLLNVASLLIHLQDSEFVVNLGCRVGVFFFVFLLLVF